MSHDDFMKLLFIKSFSQHGIEDYLKINIDYNRVKGYVLYGCNNIIVKDNKIVIEDELDYISNEKINEILCDGTIYRYRGR